MRANTGTEDWFVLQEGVFSEHIRETYTIL